MTSQAWEKEISFVLLQLVNGLKSLQAQGIEEIEASLDQFLLIRADKDPHYRLMILNGKSVFLTRVSPFCQKLLIQKCIDFEVFGRFGN